MRQSQRTSAFSSRLWDWFERHKRTLPWRDLDIKNDTQRAYMILVSEIMLQQTQVSRVEVIFKRFLREFPTIKELANASNKQVIVAWRGMGYNSRALRLRDAAKQIIEGRKGRKERKGRKVEFPIKMEELLAIKGIGPYTAAAIRNFAFHIPTPCIDTNIRRIVHRVYIGPENPDGTPKKSDKELLPIAGDVMKIALESKTKHRSSDLFAALMDFGSAMCKKSNPRCDICPMAKDGLCKAAFKIQKIVRVEKKEPGRLVGSTFIPNRIFRGRIIEVLRDEQRGMTFDQIGKHITIDWNINEHTNWLQAILAKLIQEEIVKKAGSKYILSE